MRNVGSVSGNCAVPGCLAARGRRAAPSRAGAAGADGAPGVADRAARSAACSRRCADSWTRTTRHVVSCGPSVPVVVAAAFGQRRHRREVLAEPREPRRTADRCCREPVIDPDVELVLIDGLVADPAVVVRRPGRGRQRIALQQRARDRIDPSTGIVLPGNGVRVAPPPPIGRRRRIVDGRHAPADRLGEDALPLQHRRHGRDRPCGRWSAAGPGSRRRRTCDRAGSVRRARRRTGCGGTAACRVGRREEVARVQRLVPEELERRAVQLRCCRTWWSG